MIDKTKANYLYHIKRPLGRFLRILTIIAICVVITLTFNRNTHQKLGVFDPNGIFASNQNIYYELSYFSWDKNNKKIINTIKSVAEKHRIPVITIEPWLLAGKTGSDILEETTKGNYDDIINPLCTDLVSIKTPIIVRWGHEMEISTNRYPWSGKDPKTYREAYRHFVTQCRTHDDTHYLSFMWSPSGEENSVKYWPGDDVVDNIGVSVYSFDMWDKKNLGYVRSFQQVFLPKYLNLKKFNKPIIIAEMGVTGTDLYKKSWLNDALFKATFYRQLNGYIYFNSIDNPQAWGSDLPTPDWIIKSL